MQGFARSRQFDLTPTFHDHRRVLSVREWLLLSLAVVPLYFVSLGRHSSLDGHEILVAQTAREMLESGEWIVPHFSGEIRLQKPPLAYWLTAGTFASTGRVDEFVARLPVAIATLAQIALLAWFGARCFGAPVGLTTGILHATTFWTVRFGKSALVDNVLVTLVVAAIVWSTFDRLLPIRNRHRWVITFWIWCGLSVLAKGPVGLAVIVPTVILYRSTRGRHRDDVPLFFTWTTVAGLMVFSLLSIGWPALVLAREPEAARLWYEQSVGRFLEHWGPNTRPWYYYCYQIPLLTLPWSPLWITEWIRTARNRGMPAQELEASGLRQEYRLLWIWSGVAFLFFSFSEGKREHYVLPGLPPLSLLAAMGLLHWKAIWQAPLERIASAISPPRWTVAVLLIAAGGLASFVGYPSPFAQTGVFAIVLAIGLAGREAVAWTRANHSSPAGLRFFLCVSVAWILADSLVVPAFARRTETLALFERHRELLKAAERVVQYGSNDRWAIFPLNRRMAWPRTTAELKQLVESSPRTLLLVPRKRVEEVRGVVAFELVEDVESASEDSSQQLVLLRPRTWR
ncbi:MAG: glycosyltransferase family 39 protein [Planctomycetota bacterium]